MNKVVAPYRVETSRYLKNEIDPPKTGFDNTFHAGLMLAGHLTITYISFKIQKFCTFASGRVLNSVNIIASQF